MLTFRARAVPIAAALPILVVAVVAPAGAAAPAPAPPPGDTAAGAARLLPEGPWPPGEILARNPADVTAPSLAAASTPCPPAPYGVHYSAPGPARTVALTFDDGPGVTTAAILSILARTGVPATFFNVGVNETVRPQLVRSEVVSGHAVGNHTWDHPQLPTLSAAAQAGEMDRTTAEQQALVAVTPCLFRPPYGEYNATTLSLAQQRHLAVWNWSVDTEDWKAGTSTSSYWVQRIISRAEAGGSQQHPVVLMHNPPAGIPATVSALPAIIDYYRSHGYQFVDLLGRTGQVAAPPAAAASSAGLHVLVRSTAGTVWERTLRGSAWTGWASLPGGQIVGGPAAAAIGPATLAVLAAGTDNQIYRRTVSDSGASTAWSSLGGLSTTRPNLTVGPDGVESVVLRGTNGQAYLRQRVGSRWGSWQSLGGLLAPLAPAVAATAGGALTVAAVAADGALQVRTRSPAGTWSVWQRVGGVVNADLSGCATADRTRLAVALRGTDQRARVVVGNAAGTSWTGWTNLGGVLTSGPAITANGTTLEVFGVGTDNRLHRDTATDGTLVTGWTGWHALP
jgi:peptidoglycan/xylan/chitin deacetylase (PgdA/CDA1 family)